MTLIELLTELRSRKIKLQVKDGKLSYSAPKGMLTDELKMHVIENKDEILSFLDVETTRKQLSAEKIEKISRDGDLVLSFSQERLWFIDQFEPGNVVYNIPSAVPWKGPIDFHVLKKSVNEIVRRHETLRTSFIVKNRQPVQIIAPPGDIDMPVIDLSRMGEVEKRRESQRLTDEETRLPFDLSEGNLFRMKILRLESAYHILLITFHHIIADGWSIGVFFNELSALYQAFGAGRESPLGELPFQYADYAHWQRNYLSGSLFDEQISYWKNQLREMPFLLKLPIDKKRPLIQTYNGAMESFTLNEAVALRCKQMALDEGVTLFMLLLSFYTILLMKYTGQEDIVIGSPIANRNRSEIEGLIGFFINTILLRSKPAGSKRFLEYLKEVRKMNIEAFAHQEMPFERLVEEMQPERNITYNPMFQVMFVLQNVPTIAKASQEDNKQYEETHEFADIVTGTSKFELTLSMTEVGDTIAGTFEYNSDLFYQSTIRKLIQHFTRVIENILENPYRCIADIETVSRDERAMMVRNYATMQTYDPHRKRIIAEIEDSAKKNADACAIIGDQVEITHGELNTIANACAKALKEKGIGHGKNVAVMLDNDIDTIITVLGLMKIGARCVVIDADHNRDQLKNDLSTMEISWMITGKEGKEMMRNTEIPGIMLVDFINEWKQTESWCNEDLCTEHIAPGDETLLYVCANETDEAAHHFKITESAAHEALDAISDLFDVNETTRLYQATKLGAGGVLFGLWLVLSHGGCLMTKITKKKSTAIRDLNDYGITHVIATPTQAINEDFGKIDSLKVLAITGEQCNGCIQKGLKEGVRLIDIYSTGRFFGGVYAGKYRGEDSDIREGIGSALKSTELYVVDHYYRIVPDGVVGKLCVPIRLIKTLADDGERGGDTSGGSVFRHPLHPHGAVTVYRTDDLVRRLPDGNIYYIGRENNEVNIDGLTIDTLRIEKVLGSLAGVKDARVVMKNNVDGGDALVAYLLLEKNRSVTVDEIRKQAKDMLPNFMLPKAYLSIDRYPIRKNGKLDHERLRSNTMGQKMEEKKKVQPEGAVENTLVKIWESVLNKQGIAIDSNFFRLGGHSLLATQVISRVRESFEVELPLLKMFADPTIKGMAEKIETMLWVKEGDAEEEIAETEKIGEI